MDQTKKTDRQESGDSKNKQTQIKSKLTLTPYCNNLNIAYIMDPMMEVS